MTNLTNTPAAPLSAEELDALIERLNKLANWIEPVGKGSAADIRALIAQARAAAPLSATSVNSLCSAQDAESAAAPVVAKPPKIEITLRQAHQLVAFFGGHDARVTVMPPAPDWEQQMPGLYAYCTEYPEDGSEYLGPTEVDDDLTRLGEQGMRARAALAQQAAAQPANGGRDGMEAAAKALTERAGGHFRNGDDELQDECLQCAAMIRDMKPAPEERE